MCRLFATAFAPAALLASLACSPAAALEAVTGAELVMHIGPGAEHRAVASVPAETRVTVHGCIQAEHWCLVRFAGRRGWIPGETLDVTGFSRPPTPPPAAGPAPRQVIVLPVPIEPQAFADGIVSAEDVIIGVDEQFGLAAFAGSAASFAPFRIHPGKGLRFGKRGFHSGKNVRFGKHGVHSGKGLRFGKHGFRSGKNLHFDHLHFGQRGFRFGDHRNAAGHHRHFNKGHHATDFGKRGKFGGRSAGKVRSFGFRVKGGWRP